MATKLIPQSIGIKIKVIVRMIGHFFKEIYELLVGKRKWS